MRSFPVFPSLTFHSFFFFHLILPLFSDSPFLPIRLLIPFLSHLPISLLICAFYFISFLCPLFYSILLFIISYSVLWPPFFHSFEKKLSPFKWSIYIVSLLLSFTLLFSPFFLVAISLNLWPTSFLFFPFDFSFLTHTPTPHPPSLFCSTLHCPFSFLS